MEIRNTYTLLAVIIFISSLAGCGESVKKENQKIDQTAEAQQPADPSIRDLAEIVAFNPIPVKGIGLVVGLFHTGSSECPTTVRNYLRQYIVTQLGQKGLINPDAMISSSDTAVVLVEGLIAPGAGKYQPFDVTVKALPNTQTTSLSGGRLYTTELKFITRIEESIESSKTLALAAGPVYIDNLSDSKPDQRTGLVFGGGRVAEDQQIMMTLFKPDYGNAALMRNKINQRFGRDVATATSPQVIYLSIPKKFKDRKEKFVEILMSIHVNDDVMTEQARIDSLVKSLQTDADKSKYQTALEAIGRPAVNELLPLLDSADDNTKFAAAKCLLAIGDQRALKSLRNYALDTACPFRIDAIRTIGDYAGRNDVSNLMNTLLRENNFDVRYNAYICLRKYDDDTLIRSAVSQNFYIDQAIQTGPKTIYVARTQQPCFVLFGAPIVCENNIYIESDDGRIIINSLPDDANYISVMRKHPLTGELMGPLKCSSRLDDLIKILGDDPAPENEKKRSGLGVPYSDIAALLKKMVDKGAIRAEFVAGPLSAN